MSRFEVGRPREHTHAYTAGSSAPLCGRDAPLHEVLTEGSVEATAAMAMTSCPQCRQVLIQEDLRGWGLTAATNDT